MYKIVLLRHGESEWNSKNLFTGWTDIDLDAKGIKESKKAGRILKREGYNFDLAYTSYLKRAIHTLWRVLDVMDHCWVPTIKAWQLNERHYGALQGLNKAKTAKKYGEDQVQIWRRSYDIRPAPLAKNDLRHPMHDKRYTHLKPSDLPSTECLKDTVARVLPFWKKDIVPNIKKKHKIIIAAHGNSLRALVKHLDNISDEDISHLNIPTGVPLVYELDKNLKPIKHYYLGSKKEIQKAINAVKKQGKVVHK